MGCGAQRHGDFLASQLACRIFVDLQSGRNNTIVVFGIGNRHVDDLDILTSRSSNHEGRHTLRHRDLNIARRHRCGHRSASVKAHPVNLGAHGFFVHAGFFGVLKGHGPFKEIGNGDLTVTPCKGTLGARQHGRGRDGPHKLGFKCHLYVSRLSQSHECCASVIEFGQFPASDGRAFCGAGAIGADKTRGINHYSEKRATFCTRKPARWILKAKTSP